MKRIFVLLALLAFAAPANAQAPSPENSRVPPAAQLTVLAPLPTNVWKLGSPISALPGYFEIQRNGKILAGFAASQLAYCQGSVSVLGRDKAWWKAVKDDAVSVQWEKTGTLPCDVPPPPPPALCLGPNTGGKFTINDKARVKVGTKGWQLRAAPDINLPAVPPDLAEGSENIVVCVQKVGTDQWIQIDTRWARETCCDKVGPIVPPPPPPPDNPIEPPPTDASYYVSPTGSDLNDGLTIFTPFKTPRFAVKKLKPGQALYVRGAEYETDEFMENGQNVIPSGESWLKPIIIRAYPGEKPTFRRYLPPGYDEAAVMKAAHMATKAQCDAFMAARGQPNYSFPKDCFTGSGSDPSGLYVQLDTFNPIAFGSAVIKWQRTPTPGSLQYVIIDGIDIDAKGLVANANSFPESPNCSNWRTDTCSGKHIRFQNLTIRNSILSCMGQSGVGDDQQIVADIQFINVTIDRCGVPFDPNRAAYGSLIPFFHSVYAHSCGNMLINSRVTRAAGTGVSFDCDKNIIRGNYFEGNNAHGIYISGGHDWIVENNVVVNNGGAQITLYGGHGHQIRHNTLLQTVATVAQYGLLFNTNASDSVACDNIIIGANIGVYNLSQVTPRITACNNLIWGAAPGREVYNPSGVVNLIESNNAAVDPKLDANYRPLPGSPAIGKASDGKDIGAFNSSVIGSRAVMLTGPMPKPIEIKTIGKVTVVRRPVDSGDVAIRVNEDLSVEVVVDKSENVQAVKP